MLKSLPTSRSACLTLSHTTTRSPLQRTYFTSRNSYSRSRIHNLSLQVRASGESSPTPAVPAVALSSFKKHSWEWNGYKTAYVTAGCGKPVVLVHGFGASALHFRNQISFLSQQGYKVYALDLLGFGSSEKPIIDYSMEVWDQQIRDFMQEFIGESSPAIIMGNSVGSLATLMVAAKIPDRVSGVVLFNCAGGMNNKAISDDWRIKLAMPIFLLIDWILNQPKLARRLFDNVRQTDNLKQILEGVYPRNPAAVDDDLVNMLHGPSNDPGALETFVSVITGPPGPRPEELIPKITAPMLLFWGDADNFTPSNGPVGKYFQSLPEKRSVDTKFIHLNKCGHCPMDEASEEVHSILLPWMNALSS